MPSLPITLNATLTLSATPEQLWPLISDTGRINRAVGLPALEQNIAEPDFSRTIYSHYMGVPISWREYPYEWVVEQWYMVERSFPPLVPIEHFTQRTSLTALPDDKTRLDIELTYVPRGLLGRLSARMYIGQKLLPALLQTYRTFGDLASAPTTVPPPPVRAPIVNTQRLKLAATRLNQLGIAPMLTEQLVAYLRTADDSDVLRMRPFALADVWGQPRLDVLRLFLNATRVNLLDLEWEVLCPECRGPSVSTGSLGELEADAHCEACQVHYHVNFDETVELRFSVNPDIRAATNTVACVGGPAITRHVVAQFWLPAQESKSLTLRLAAGSYRLHSHQSDATVLIHVVDGASNHTATVRLDMDELAVTDDDLAPGMVTLTCENTSDTNLLVALDQTAWSSQAVSAALVTSMDEFRQLFSSQLLAPGLGIAIRSLTFLFSDLQDSTLLYDSIGDTQAYARVRDHFDVLQSIIARQHGALVKTIGDAVMAVFSSVEDAVAASLAIQREFIEGEIARGNPALRVKLGLHRGACIAVNANDVLDYFGSTVNIAARVQNESKGGDIVVTNEIMSDPGVARLLGREHLLIETFDRELKGFEKRDRDSTIFGPDGRARLYRLRFSRPQPQFFTPRLLVQ